MRALSPGDLCHAGRISSKGHVAVWRTPGINVSSLVSVDSVVLVLSLSDRTYAFVMVGGQLGHIALDYLEKA